MRPLQFCRLLIVPIVLSVVGAFPANADTPYIVAYTDGGSWNNVYVQGFSTSLGASPVPGASNGDTVQLNQFQFFKSGNVDTATNIQLAILNNIFPNNPTVNNLTTASAPVVGLSTNTILTDAAILTGQPITFSFNNLPLIYGNNYAAMYVNVGAETSPGSGVFALTPVQVSSLTANYADTGGGVFHPVTNYGTESQFIYGTSNFINNGFFNIFSFAGDANFSASLVAVPEPGCVAFSLISLVALATRRRSAR